MFCALLWGFCELELLCVFKAGCMLLACAVGCRLMKVSAEFNPFVSNAVDLYNSTSGTWSTAQLSVARNYPAATSVGNMAIFAGGTADNNGNFSFAQCD